MSTFTVLGSDSVARAQGILRIVAGFLFLQHATAKLFGVPHVAYFDHLQLFSLPGIAGMIELIGAPLLILGACTRLVAFILSGEMAFVYFIGHVPQGNLFAPLLNQGEPAVLYCFIFLFLAAAGPGAWSLDSLRQKRLVAGNSGAQPQRAE
jgi:putative oxidoreductase